VRTLIIAAHMDDEVLGAAVLIQRRVVEGIYVRVITIFGRRYGYGKMDAEENQREAVCAERARKILGYPDLMHYLQMEGEPGKVGYYKLLKDIEENLHYFNPTEVVIPAATDLNQDHRHLHEVCRIALRPANLHNVTRVLAMRAFDPPPSDATYFLPHDSIAMQKKLDALSCYVREVRTGAHPRSEENLRAAHRLLGARVGAEYAEGYDVVLQREDNHEGCDHGRDGVHRE
jgi:LmbE family N-acetylglucosaminyl deacetylase